MIVWESRITVAGGQQRLSLEKDTLSLQEYSQVNRRWKTVQRYRLTTAQKQELVSFYGMGDEWLESRRDELEVC
jgi:ribosomal protein S4